jgi:flagellar hook-associated protein 3 FlgL
MRVTPGMMMNSTLHNIELNQSRTETLQNQITSGSRISKPSDDPIGAARSINLQESLTQSAQYVRNIDQASSWLNSTDSVLESVTLAIHRSRELAVQAANGAVSGVDRQAIDAELEQIQQHVLDLSHSKYGPYALFSGTQTSSTGYTAAAVSGSAAGVYQGNNGQVLREVAPGTSIAVNADAQATFDPLFKAIATLRAGIAADDQAGISSSVGELDTALDAVSVSRAALGAKTNRLDFLKSRQENISVNLTGLLSQVKDVDMAEAIMNFTMSQNVYSASLKAGAQALQPSLLDFL